MRKLELLKTYGITEALPETSVPACAGERSLFNSGSKRPPQALIPSSAEKKASDIHIPQLSAIPALTQPVSTGTIPRGLPL